MSPVVLLSCRLLQYSEPLLWQPLSASLGASLMHDLGSLVSRLELMNLVWNADASSTDDQESDLGGSRMWVDVLVACQRTWLCACSKVKWGWLMKAVKRWLAWYEGCFRRWALHRGTSKD
ncbi:uncharacterized protein UHOD_11467 [Ustilago sp. UG-2017b]|nr:uncharacterized protein UHOD_11467 [Ustilago sp. UG-2017b]